MNTQLSHSGGLVDAVIELGFDAVKYFEGTMTGSPSTITISPPARRLTVKNLDADNAVFLNITGASATTAVSFVPGDNIKVAALCTFEMDFDSLTSLSFITAGANVEIQGVLGFKGTQH